MADIATSRAPVTVGLMSQALEPFMVEIRTLKRRVSELEGRRTMAFEGAFDPGRKYLQGDVVQKSAGLYVALAGTSEPPGESSQWRRIGVAR